MDAETFLALKRKTESLQSKKDRLEGMSSQLQTRMKSEVACKTLEELGKLKNKLEREVEKEEVGYSELVAGFEEEHGERL